MDCREFRHNHLAFVDGALADGEHAAMQTHLAVCPDCLRHDTAMRRGLLVFRNLPAIEPSCDFSARLYARIQQLHQADARAAMYRGPGLGSFVASAAAVVTVGYLAATLLSWSQPARELSLAPVMAIRPPPAALPIVNQGVMASVAAGLPMWSAAVIAEQAPVRFASEEFGR